MKYVVVGTIIDWEGTEPTDCPNITNRVLDICDDPDKAEFITTIFRYDYDNLSICEVDT